MKTTSNMTNTTAIIHSVQFYFDTFRVRRFGGEISAVSKRTGSTTYRTALNNKRI